MNPQNNLYDVLEVSPHASALVIRAAYRYLAQFNHPDKLSGAVAACNRLALINHAYAVLSDPERRRHYDQTLHRALPALERRGAGRAVAAQARPAGANGITRPFVFRPLR